MTTAFTTTGTENSLKRVNVNEALIQSKELEDFLSLNMYSFFKITGILLTFFSTNPASWEDDEHYAVVKPIVSSIRVVNDIAECGVVLIDEYNKLHTNDEEQKQYLMLVVKEYRKHYSDRNKATPFQ